MQLHLNKRYLWLVAKLVLLAVFLWGTNLGVYQRVQAIGWQPGLAVFVLMWLLTLLCLLLVAFSPHRLTRLVWTVVLVVFSFAGLSFYLITAKYMSLSEMEKMLGVIGFADDLITSYAGFLGAAAIWCLVGAVALNVPPFAHSQNVPRQLVRLTENAGVLQFLPVFALGSILYIRGGEGTDGLPVQYNGLAFMTVLGVDALAREPHPARRPVTLAHRGSPPLRNVVLVMDESIRGDLLDVNAPGGVDTRLRLAGDAMVNFGIASSIANCSDTTNVSVRYGVTRQHYLREVYTNPSFWGYARKAGYQTVYIDGQRHDGRMQNYMTEVERGEIDQFIQLDRDAPPSQRDLIIARRLRELLESGGAPKFIFVNKMGSHFPYEGKYPRDRTVYQPTLEQNYFGNEADPKQKQFPADNDAATRLRFKNSYLNSITWNIGQFFQILLPGLDLRNTVIAYTADHGQDLHEDGRPGYFTHCTDGKVASTEGKVPMLFLTKTGAVKQELRLAAQRNAGKTSQFSLFPTLLVLMGYDRTEVTVENGFEPTLMADLPENNQRFLSTFFVRWGKQPVWNNLAR